MEKESRVSLKNMRFLFLTGSENLTPRQSKQLDLLLEAYPQFQTPYLLKEAFRNIYQFAESREETEQLYADWVQANADEDCHAFDDFISTVANWHTEIFNYFDNRYTNAQTESLNNVICEVDRAGRGYTFPRSPSKDSVSAYHRKESQIHISEISIKNPLTVWQGDSCLFIHITKEL